MWLKLGAIVAVLGLVWLHFHNDAQREQELATARTVIKDQADTNEANLATIDELEAANAAWEQQWAEYEGDFSARVLDLQAQLNSERAARARDRAAARAELERLINEDDEAADWSTDPVPAAIGDWLCNTPAVSCEGGAEGSGGTGPNGP